MVGINTIIKDNPQLTCRLNTQNPRNPIIIVVDTNLRIPIDSNVITNKSKLIVACRKNANPEKQTLLKQLGVDVIELELENNKINLNDLCTTIGKRGIDGILLEGGAELSYSAIKAGIIDEINLFIAPKIIGGRDAKSFLAGDGISKMSEAWKLQDISSTKIGDDIMITGKF
jgi:diaminohydroxyphosphoribosylaminopyrimidine deaminase/5-amino-6-(5-phosphoribosylamino)uracil reductase